MQTPILQKYLKWNDRFKYYWPNYYFIIKDISLLFYFSVKKPIFFIDSWKSNFCFGSWNRFAIISASSTDVKKLCQIPGDSRIFFLCVEIVHGHDHMFTYNWNNRILNPSYIRIFSSYSEVSNIIFSHKITNVKSHFCYYELYQ